MLPWQSYMTSNESLLNQENYFQLEQKNSSSFHMKAKQKTIKVM